MILLNTKKINRKEEKIEEIAEKMLLLSHNAKKCTKK